MKRPSPAGAGIAVTVLMLLAMLGACDKTQPCVDKSKPALDKCNANVEELQVAMVKLKGKLAEAIASPGTIRIDDPSLIEIVGKLKKRQVRAGTISEDQVVRTIRQNNNSLQPCYNRALKRDSSLHHRTIVLNLSMKVKPSGVPASISLGPNYNASMIDCVRKAIRRWKFPSFNGSSVEVSIPLTFKPKK